MPTRAQRWHRRQFLKTLATGGVSWATGPSWFAASSCFARPRQQPEPAALEPAVRQLFLDDDGIESIDGLRRVIREPTRHPDNPLLVPDTPWEDRCQVYGTAYYDEAAERFKIWYLTSPRQRGTRPLDLGTHERAPHTTLAAYAESEDGVHWTKPNLGIFPYDGDRENNLLGIGRYNCEGISVLHEPDDSDPERRWKAVYWDHGSGGWEMRDGRPYCMEGPDDGFYVAFSPDGIRWTPYEHNPVIRAYCDTNQNVLFDPRLGRYVAFSRFGFGRRLARSESEDFVHWSEPQLVLECDEADGPGTQIYGAGVDLYEGVYLAMIWIYREGGDRKIDTQLATSRDGIHWTRVAGRATWLALGEEDSWEGGMVRSVERIIRRPSPPPSLCGGEGRVRGSGETLYVYYCGVHGPHIAGFERRHPTSIGLLTIPRDRFVAVAADEQPGILVTRPFFWPQDTDLYLNADAARGHVTVSAIDENGDPYVGFHEMCVEEDVLAGRVLRAGPTRTPPADRPVRLRFTLRRAKLYGFWLA